MLIPFEIDANSILDGKNEIVIHILPAFIEARKHENEFCRPQAYKSDSMFVRKAPHMYGWDIMPRVLSAGIWRSDNVLKAIETGSLLYFDWIYSPDDEVAKMKGKEPTALLSKNYNNWIELAGKAFVQQKSKITSGAIISHSKLADNVYQTVWSDGSFIVNYSSVDVVVNGVTVESKNYVVCD